MKLTKLMKRYKAVGIAALIIFILGFAFWWGGDSPSLRSDEPSYRSETAQPSENSSDRSNNKDNQESKNDFKASDNSEAEQDAESVKKPDEPATEENKPVSHNGAHLSADEKERLAEQMAEGGRSHGSTSVGEPEQADNSSANPEPDSSAVPPPSDSSDSSDSSQITDTDLTCTLSVRCDTVLKNIAWLDPAKRGIVPSDGVIFPETEVTFSDGESVFNILLREMKKNKIHLEFVNTPVYNSAYIEGIGNIYEFDCGELSGWLYKVNGNFPSYGCSRYKLKPGDKVEWVYTCDLGNDVGGYSAGGQRDE